ncbi:hypothetical protein [Pseudoalteromonas luteoviolacea]|uniref:DUF4440 domain-containing protein n=1 Tax=Pseudoalteromonas luteoviolacea (strain 2ta16) TaxID=1353533 RepID=V4HSI1_PSEL2|nr:hypothetical protein [Pseudoalteromonas luteoviolacea]ESP90864.1 hypothetical protein PL2TA16_01255 [Pseudoalteromonas luteoviolacea 2ta16]KZN38378.1 hypothetical protein N483_20695 [Pseudoalteromonas luteoviolacea NCIMB 1944]
MWFLFMVSLVCLAFGSVASDTPQSAVNSLFQAMSHEPQKKPDIDKLKQLFHPEAKVFGVHLKKGMPSLMSLTGQEFIKLLDKTSEQGFYECEIVRKIQTYDRFSHVYSVAETRFNKDQTNPDFTGVNSIQLYKADQQWQIMSLYYQVENPAKAIALESGKSGACLN